VTPSSASAASASATDAVVVAVEGDVTQRIVTGALAGAASPAGALRAGTRAFLEVCAEPEVERILLLDAPGVLGWERWREIGQAHGLGVITAVLQTAIDAGEIPAQPVRPLAHLVLGALDEAALVVARAQDPDTEREALLAALERFLLP
jgi:hypothetical protein